MALAPAFICDFLTPDEPEDLRKANSVYSFILSCYHLNVWVSYYMCLL